MTAELILAFAAGFVAGGLVVGRRVYVWSVEAAADWLEKSVKKGGVAIVNIDALAGRDDVEVAE